jgi:predicted RNase H-like HicB family nuclease
MERIVRVHIEKLPEGVYLATSDDIQGLVAQGRTVSEVLEIARDVARKLLEAQEGPEGETALEPIADNFDYPLLVATS